MTAALFPSKSHVGGATSTQQGGPPVQHPTNPTHSPNTDRRKYQKVQNTNTTQHALYRNPEGARARTLNQGPRTRPLPLSSFVPRHGVHFPDVVGDDLHQRGQVRDMGMPPRQEAAQVSTELMEGGERERPGVKHMIAWEAC